MIKFKKKVKSVSERRRRVCYVYACIHPTQEKEYKTKEHTEEKCPAWTDQEKRI